MIPVNRSERPSSRVRLWLRWSLPAVGVALFLLPLVSSSIVYPKWDEFIVSFDAQRILNGQIPYRDFFNFIPPGIFYFLAGAGVDLRQGDSDRFPLRRPAGDSDQLAPAAHCAREGRLEMVARTRVIARISGLSLSVLAGRLPPLARPFDVHGVSAGRRENRCL